MVKDVVIVSAVRTPMGSFLGGLSNVSAVDLGSIAIKGSLDNIKLSPELVNEVFFGNVVQAGLGQAPARQAAIYANLSKTVECLTINKMCGSGLKASMLADQVIRIGDADLQQQQQ